MTEWDQTDDSQKYISSEDVFNCFYSMVICIFNWELALLLQPILLLPLSLPQSSPAQSMVTLHILLLRPKHLYSSLTVSFLSQHTFNPSAKPVTTTLKSYRIHPLLTTPTKTALVQVTIVTHLDCYCDLLTGLSPCACASFNLFSSQ